MRVRNERDGVLIEVEDNGQGIKPHTMNRIFEPFFTTKAKGEGTGLGLSISYKIITINHNGHISVRSEPGKGATFSAWIPITSPDQSLTPKMKSLYSGSGV